MRPILPCLRRKMGRAYLRYTPRLTTSRSAPSNFGC